MSQTEKRKTVTSSEVKMRYNQKAYEKYTLMFRRDDDADIIAAVDALKAQGMSTKQAVAHLIRKAL